VARPPPLHAGPPAARPGEPQAGARHLVALGRDPVQLHRRRAAAVRRDPLPRRPPAAPPARRGGGAQGPGAADHRAREAEDRGHLDERGQQPLPLRPGLLRGRLLPADRRAGRRAHRRHLRTRPPEPPAVARRRGPARQGTAVRGRAARPAPAPGPVCRGSGRRGDQRRRPLPRPHLHPQPGARRHLHRRDLFDRPGQGDRRRDQGDHRRQVRVRALRGRVRGSLQPALRPRCGDPAPAARLGRRRAVPPPRRV
ncbi:MAG: Transmembrane protein co-occuring with sulfite exporter TauE/SafE, partial [uncultured Sphingomonas sp.]